MTPEIKKRGKKIKTKNNPVVKMYANSAVFQVYYILRVTWRCVLRLTAAELSCGQFLTAENLNFGDKIRAADSNFLLRILREKIGGI